MVEDKQVELSEKILEAKKQHDAMILAHIYQPGPIQELADYVGDSLELSRQSAKSSKRLIIFCGVHFMAETASILAPDKKVVLPVLSAGCPMAQMLQASELEKLKARYPYHKVICYINSTADVKALSDCCVTSANAVAIMQKLEHDKFIFVPDRYLGTYAGKKTGKEVITIDGYCHVHMNFTEEDIKNMRSRYPGAPVMVHPEARSEVVELADFVGGTGQMVRYVGSTEADTFIVGTETGIIYRLKKLYPDREFIPLNSDAVCPDMKKISLELLLDAIVKEAPVVKVPAEKAILARKAIDEMLRLS